MAKLARAVSRFSGANAVAIVSWQEELPAITVICDVENGGMSQASVTIDNPNSLTPTIFVDRRSGAGNATGGLWRHAAFAVENAQGKTPLFRINRATKDGASAVHSLWRPVMTTDFVTWTQSGPVTFNGDTSGTFDFSFPNPLPSGRVYIASNLYGTQADAAEFADMLLTDYSSVASPTLSANASGVYNTTPAENDDISRAVGSNPQYAIKLAWPGPTTDGLRKRKLVVFAGIHAAGEQQCWLPFRQSILWMLNSSDAEAVALRANWDIYCYFLLNPNGVRGGNSRVTFRNSTDPNRDWANRTLNEIAATYNTVIADTGGTADALFSWHGDVYSTSVFQTWVWTPDYSSGTRSPEMQAMINEGTTIFGSAPSMRTSSTNNTDVWFGRSVLGAPVAFDTENAAMRESTVAFFDDVGIKWMRTLQAVDADGLFVAVELSADNCAQTDASSDASIEQSHTIVAASSEQDDSAIAGQISQTHALILADSTQTDESGTVAIDIGSIPLTVAACTQTDISSSVALTQNHALIVAASSQTDASQSVVISQAHALSTENNLQIDTSATGEITGAGDLIAANCAQSDESTTGEITQAHSITADNSAQTDTSGTGAISATSVINLAAANSAQTDTSQTAIITQTHILIAAPSVQDDVASSSAIVQLHLLLAANSIQTDASSSATIINPLDVLEIPNERIIAITRDNRIIYINQWGRYGH